MIVSNCCNYPTFYINESGICGQCKEHCEFIDEENICRGCGDEGVFIKGLCKQCAEDTYLDREDEEK